MFLRRSLELKLISGVDWSFPTVVNLLSLIGFFKVYLITFSPYWRPRKVLFLSWKSYFVTLFGVADLINRPPFLSAGTGPLSPLFTGVGNWLSQSEKFCPLDEVAWEVLS